MMSDASSSQSQQVTSQVNSKPVELNECKFCVEFAWYVFVLHPTIIALIPNLYSVRTVDEY
jgi:hypothetical protein